MRAENIKGGEDRIPLMNIICLNIVEELINKEEVGAVCLQEIKLEIVNKERCYNMGTFSCKWDTRNFNYVV